MWMSVWSQTSFIDPKTDISMNLVLYHDLVLVIMASVLVLVGWFLLIFLFQEFFFKGCWDFTIKENQKLEVAWTITPSFFLFGLGYVSLWNLYSMEVGSGVMHSVEAHGHQWYWDYHYVVNMGGCGTPFLSDVESCLEKDLNEVLHNFCSSNQLNGSSLMASFAMDGKGDASAPPNPRPATTPVGPEFTNGGGDCVGDIPTPPNYNLGGEVSLTGGLVYESTLNFSEAWWKSIFNSMKSGFGLGQSLAGFYLDKAESSDDGVFDVSIDVESKLDSISKMVNDLEESSSFLPSDYRLSTGSIMSFLYLSLGGIWNLKCESYGILEESLNQGIGFDGGFRNQDVTCPCFLAYGVKNEVKVSTSDVMHSWGVAELGVKADAVPGRINSVGIKPLIPGFAYGNCYELCGPGHSGMPIVCFITSLVNVDSFLKCRVLDMDEAWEKLDSIFEEGIFNGEMKFKEVL